MCIQINGLPKAIFKKITGVGHSSAFSQALKHMLTKDAHDDNKMVQGPEIRGLNGDVLDCLKDGYRVGKQAAQALKPMQIITPSRQLMDATPDMVHNASHHACGHVRNVPSLEASHVWTLAGIMQSLQELYDDPTPTPSLDKIGDDYVPSQQGKKKTPVEKVTEAAKCNDRKKAITDAVNLA
ncbi:uncharacterized protein LAESUDRAFT_715728 [Laetiporus sulphureus 93-53]|uniref:Uncharacterized protein n=1 Tax=Laetiporus sulphureus 93-53 TaxID=1314785 RepID=A0A165D5I7_9APHY|nr:uncharacterized protein LAESUDRAFT_715728 [Laetiporus sulphureus 93-53]KZT04189.1 hypothetical protein LAESUDRAFT_715728 [Laetiporus sulphureus 93-53]